MHDVLLEDGDADVQDVSVLARRERKAADCDLGTLRTLVIDRV